jgi:hypothetical protein
MNNLLARVQTALTKATDNRHAMHHTEGNVMPYEWRCPCGVFIQWRFTPTLIRYADDQEHPAIDISMVVSVLIDQLCTERTEG